MTDPAEQNFYRQALRDSLDERAARMNGEILHFRPDGTPSPETERLLRSVRLACDRFWARRRARKISENSL